MSESYYPEDEFDQPDPELRQPVGVHRERPAAWRSWAPLIAVIVVVPLLAWGAVSLLGQTSGRSGASDASTQVATEAATAEGTQQEQGDASANQAAPASPEASAAPSATTADADLTTGITVINGTTTQGLAGRTGDRLTNVGYTGVSVQQGVYEQSTPATTTLYYAAPANEATARAVAQTLGISNVVESADFAQSNPLVLVLRSDFTE